MKNQRPSQTDEDREMKPLVISLGDSDYEALERFIDQTRLLAYSSGLVARLTNFEPDPKLLENISRFAANLEQFRTEHSTKQTVEMQIPFSHAQGQNFAPSITEGARKNARELRDRHLDSKTFYVTLQRWLASSRRDQGNRKYQISKPPGAQWMRFACFFFSPESVTEIFEPWYKDFWYEYEKALVTGQKWKGRWIRVRYYWAFAKATGLVKFFSWIWDRVEAVISKIA